MAVEMTKDKSKDLSSGQSIFRRELMEVEESEIDFLEITHVPVAEGKTMVRVRLGPVLQFEDDWLQWCSVDCPFLFWGVESGKSSKTLGSQVRVEMSQAPALPLVSGVTWVRKEPLWPAAPLPHSECTGAASPTGLLEGSCDSNRHQEMLKVAARAYQFPFLQQKYQFVRFSCVDVGYIVSVSLTDKTHQDSLGP